MELTNTLKNMRFSSVLMASFAVSAGLGWVGPASAQVVDVATSELDDASKRLGSSNGLGAIDSQQEHSELYPHLWRLDDGSLPERIGSPEHSSVYDLASGIGANAESDGGVALRQPWNPTGSAFADFTSMAVLAQAFPNDPVDAPVLDTNPEPTAPDVPETLDVEPPPAPDTPVEQPDAVLEGEDDVQVEPDVPEAIEEELEEEAVEEEELEDALDEETGVEGEAEAEPRVLVAEVFVSGVEERPDLETIVYNSIETSPGRTTTRSQLQEDINSVFATGFFSNVQAVPEDTPLGVRITFVVDPNPILTTVQVVGSALQEQGVTLTYTDPFGGIDVVPEQLTIQEVVNRIFSPQYGETLNLLQFQRGVEALNEIYQENGYVLAQVIDAPPPTDDGVVLLEVAEGVIEDIEVIFLDEDGLAVDEDGEPIEGRTRDFIITREFESEPGDVFNQQQIQRDLQDVFALGIFDDVRVTLDPGEDPRQVDVVVNVIEGNTGSVAAGVGFSSASGVFGSLSYQQQNLGGNNQRLGAEVQFGQRELLFDVRFTDPWIATDPYQTSYTVNAFSRRSISLIFDGGEDEVELENGDRPRVQRIGGGVSFSRPLDEWLGWEGWRASTGFRYERVSIRDADGELTPEDELGNDLSFSGDGQDDLFTLQLAAVRDRRNNTTQPTSGSLLRVGTEQSLPFGSGSILFNRLRASYSFYVPVSFTNFNDGPEALAFNVQAGTVVGDLPPYEAFSLGGTDSVRGYDAGDLGSGRSFLQATAEYRFPIFSIVGGALFFDFGTDLGTASDVPGEPAEIRDKPGTGFGYGIGIRVQSPLGPIRVDYGINDDGEGQIHFGIGERF